MAALVQTDKFGAMNAIATITIGYYIIKFMSEAYTLEQETM